MDFETGMENLTIVCDGDCDCSPDPALLLEKSHSTSIPSVASSGATST